MAIDSRGIEYNPFLPSVQTADGAVFQILTGEVSPETGVEIVDMQASVIEAAAYEAV